MAVITDSVYCPGCCEIEPQCFGHNEFAFGSGGDVEGPCVDFLTSTSTGAPSDGLYLCSGGVDDAGTISWPSGSFYSPANIHQCYGAHEFSFTAYFNEGDTVTIEAGSTAGPVGSAIECCKIEAP